MCLKHSSFVICNTVDLIYQIPNPSSISLSHFIESQSFLLLVSASCYGKDLLNLLTVWSTTKLQLCCFLIYFSYRLVCYPKFIPKDQIKLMTVHSLFGLDNVWMTFHSKNSVWQMRPNNLTHLLATPLCPFSSVHFNRVLLCSHIDRFTAMLPSGGHFPPQAF